MIDVFEPQLRLMKDSEGNFVLQATTLTPNSCHVAGETEVMPPRPPYEPNPPGGGVSPLPGPRVMEVKLHIKETESDICLPYIKPVHHRVQLDPPEQTTSIQAIVVVKGEKVKEKSFPVDPSDETPEEPGSIVGTEDFQAFLDLMPVGEPTLRVQGNVVLPDPGYRTKLVKAENAERGNTFVLNLEVEHLDGIFPQVVTTRSVEYEQSGSDLKQFDRVKILLPSDKTLTLNIREVQ
ncbi:hypothetical protein [Phormidium sp. CCY1219]|uniref:hypothetical protein n=1 Tax=Phormidium sp. CCY1219 TaxID=2886104 RepID=UPI002D1F84C9|nr:hypothetical protein [Phormidium sp. CCY1219]MEB3827439.1 hypothetical protein [Phormidium sp. CCY1219]